MKNTHTHAQTHTIIFYFDFVTLPHARAGSPFTWVRTHYTRILRSSKYTISFYAREHLFRRKIGCIRYAYAYDDTSHVHNEIFSRVVTCQTNTGGSNPWIVVISDEKKKKQISSSIFDADNNNADDDDDVICAFFFVFFFFVSLHTSFVGNIFSSFCFSLFRSQLTHYLFFLTLLCQLAGVVS